jgi:hypothetical protein
LLVKALRGDSVATATVAATAAVVIVAGIGIHTRLGIEITKLTQDILVLLHVADLRLCVRQLGTKLIQVLGLDQIACQLILLNNGRLDVTAASLHLGAQLIEGKLVSITVLKNLLLGRAIAREDITLNLRKIIRNDRGAITETAIAEETTAIVSVLLIKILFQLNSWPPY